MSEAGEISPNVVDATANGIARGAALLRRGGLVAFPTETVYGLGAAAFDERAVARVYKAKGRPADNPLIVHVSSPQMLDRVAESTHGLANTLMHAFWPGPLTLVMARSRRLPPIVSAGLHTVAVRMPADPVALQLIRFTGQPVAAPSANRSGRPSPTTAAHVLRDLGGLLDLVIDGGPTSVGLESTVVDVTGGEPVLLRAGGVPVEDIERVAGCRLTLPPVSGPVRSPGMSHRHYAPTCGVIAVTPGDIAQAIHEAARQGMRIGVICRTAVPPSAVGITYLRSVPGDESAYARELFAGFREAEEEGVQALFVETVEETGVGRAIMDRLRRAAADELLPPTKEDKIEH